MTDNIKNWNTAVGIVIEEQAEEGTFRGDTAIFTSEDAQQTYKLLAEHLNADNLWELLNDHAAVPELIMQSIILPASAAANAWRIQTAIGSAFLEQHREEIEELHAQLRHDYAATAYWDMATDSIKECDL